MNSPAIPNRRSFRTIATRSAPTAGRSRFPRSGPGWTSSSTSAPSNRSSTSGSTAKRSASARTRRRPPSSNITRFLKPGENVLAVEVYRWSDGSYLECQDFWRLAGIERDVYLYAAPKVRIRDFEVRAGLDGTYRNGRLGVDGRDRRGLSRDGESLTGPSPMTLLDAAGQGRSCSAVSGVGRDRGGRPRPPSVSTGRSRASGAGAPRPPTSTGSFSSSGIANGKIAGSRHVEDRLPDERDQGRPAPRQRRAGPAQGRQPPRARSRTRAMSSPKSPCGATSSS